MILRVEDDSQWREVVGGCNPCRRLAGKWLEDTTKRGLGCWSGYAVGRERGRREERESVLKLLGANEA